VIVFENGIYVGAAIGFIPWKDIVDYQWNRDIYITVRANEHIISKTDPNNQVDWSETNLIGFEIALFMSKKSMPLRKINTLISDLAPESRSIF